MVNNSRESIEFDPLDVSATEATYDIMRHSVRNILRSYHDWWDIFAEVIQNSMDSVFERWVSADRSTYTPEINIFLDKVNNYRNYDFISLYTKLSIDNVSDTNIVKVVINNNFEAIYFSRSIIPYNFKSIDVEYFNTIGLFYWNAKSLKNFCSLPISKLELIEDTHMLRMIENKFTIKMIYTEINTIDVNVPEDILKVEEYFNVDR